MKKLKMDITIFSGDTTKREIKEAIAKLESGNAVFEFSGPKKGKFGKKNWLSRGIVTIELEKGVKS